MTAALSTQADLLAVTAGAAIDLVSQVAIIAVQQSRADFIRASQVAIIVLTYEPPYIPLPIRFKLAGKSRGLFPLLIER